MGWFERHAAGRDPREVSREQGRYVRAAGVDRALEALAGPYGVRRFLVRFAVRGARVRVTALEAIPLSWGGGPPPADPSAQLRSRLEQALGRLHTNMASGPRWSRGAASFLRDARGGASLRLVFDEDADEARLDDLPMPPKPGHPLEAPETRDLFAAWEHGMVAIHQRSARFPQDHAAWEIEGDWLTLHYGGDPDEGEQPTRTERRRCQVLATYSPKAGELTWQCAPLFEEAVFSRKSFPSTFDAAMQVGLLAAARIGADLLLALSTDERGTVLTVAVRA